MPSEYFHAVWYEKLEWCMWLPDGKNKFEDMFRTDNRTDILRRHNLHYA